MICVTVFTDSKHNIYTGINMSGHAGNAVNAVEGQELVCAAVSALAINMANSVEHLTEDKFQVDTDDGKFDFRFTSDISHESELLMTSFVFGIEDIEESYGEPYIKIRFEEV